jgi:hypothetical protein
MTATNVVITDVIPADTQWASGGTYIGARNWVSFTQSSLGPNAPVGFTFVVTVDTPLDDGTILTNSDFRVASDQTFAVGVPITIEVDSAPILNILKVSDPTP